MLITQFGILFVLIILSAFFSGIETALVSLNMIKVKTLVKQNKKGSAPLLRLKKDPNRLIITILIGNNLVNIGAASFATVLFTDLFGSGGVGIATGVMTFLILVFGEITPKTYCAQNAEKISLKVARIVEWLSFALWPFIKVFGLISKAVTKLFSSGDGEKLSQEELKTIVTMGRNEGLLSKNVAEMMHNVLEFKGTKVTEVMTPKVDMEMVDGEKQLDQIIDHVVKTPYSRYPVFSKSKNKIVGILDVDDVLEHAKNKTLHKIVKNIARPVFFIPESKEVDELLVDFEGKEEPVAIVVDEYGDVKGLVTTEDIIEEIVGEIFDKSEKASTYIKRINKKTVQVDARAPIEEINIELGLKLKQKNYYTIAGYIEYQLKRIPKKGETLKAAKYDVIVTDVNQQGIKSVKIVKK